MASEDQEFVREMTPTDMCWIIRSPDGEHVLKDEDHNAVLVFTDEVLASAFATKEVGAGNFRTEESVWLTLALRMKADGFAGAVIDHVRGNRNMNLALFTKKGLDA